MNKLKLIMIILLVLLTSGCYDRREISSLGIVNSFIADYQKPNINLIAEVVNIKTQATIGQGSNSLPYIYVKGSGKSFLPAVNDIKRVLGSYPYAANLKSAFITEAYAKEKGLVLLLEDLLRSFDTRQAEYLFVIKGDSEFYKSASSLNDYIGDHVERSSSEKTGFSSTIFKKVLEVIKDYNKDNQTVVVGTIIQEKIASEEETNINVDDDQKNNRQVKLEGSAIFKKDKFIGFLDGPDTELYNLLTGNIKNGALIPIINETTLFISKVEPSTKIKFKKQKLTIDINLKTEINVQTDTGKKNFSDPKTIMKIEKKFNKKYEDEIKAFLIRNQHQFGIDYFGFGEQLHISNPRIWRKIKKDWDKYYSEAIVNVHVESTFVRNNKFVKSLRAEI